MCGQSPSARDAACLETRRPRRQASKDCRSAANDATTARDAVVPARKAEPRRGGGAGPRRRRRRRGPRWARRCRRPKRCRPTASPPVLWVSSSSSWSPSARNHRSRRFSSGTRRAACTTSATRLLDVAAAARDLERRGFRVLAPPAPARHGVPVVFLHPKETHGTLLELQGGRRGVRCDVIWARLSPRRRLGRVLGHVEELSRPGPVARESVPLALAQGWGRRSARNPTRHALGWHGQ